MKLKDYLASKAVSLCFLASAALFWGVFAFLVGASPFLLWGSEALVAITVFLRYVLGYWVARRRVNQLWKLCDSFPEKYLLGELVPPPFGVVEREYFEIMKLISRDAIGKTEQAKQEKEEYFESVERWVHEIKTPLTACTLICDNGGDLKKIRRELRRADNCTDTILQYARLRSSQNDRRISKFQIAETVEKAIQSQRELLIASGIGVTISGDFAVYSDEKSVIFILKQLLINCAKYCPGCRIAINACEGTITVTDNGPGIGAHELPRVTERGFTGENGKAGTGMGLYIVSEICTLLEIKMQIRSVSGKGTSFEFTFPSA